MDVMRFYLDQHSVNTACVPVSAARALLKKKSTPKFINWADTVYYLFPSFNAKGKSSRRVRKDTGQAHTLLDIDLE